MNWYDDNNDRRVAIYVRLSHEDVDKLGKDYSRSIINQKEFLLFYCEERSWNDYEIYCDEDITGMEENRPEFQRMLSDCYSGKYNTIIVKDISRFSRDRALIIRYLQRDFLKKCILFIDVANDRRNTDSDFVDWSDNVSQHNERHCRDTSNKVKTVFRFKEKKGIFIGAFAPYGYKKDPDDKGHLIPDDNVKDIVKRIFEEYASGKSIRSIAIKLNEEGIPSPTAYKRANGNYYSRAQDNQWSTSSILTILNNEACIGNIVQGKTQKTLYSEKGTKKVPSENWIRAENMHEPIISRELWEKAQARRDTRCRVSRDTDTLCPLTSKVVCGVCGKVMKRHVSHGKGEKRSIKYYSMQCADCYRGKLTCTNSRSISGAILERDCLRIINEAIEEYCNSGDIAIHQFQRERIEELIKQSKSLKNKADTVQNRLDRLVIKNLDGDITDDEFRRYKQIYAAELEEIRGQIESNDTAIQTAQEKAERSENKAELFKKYSHISELTRAIADDFIDRITVGEPDESGDRKVNILLKI